MQEVVWKNIHFIMWDLGGQESLRAAWNTYYSNTEVCTSTKFNNHVIFAFIKIPALEMKDTIYFLNAF